MKQGLRLRLVLLCVLVAAMAAGIGARLWQLQVRETDQFAARAERQHQSRIAVPARRGAILDREGRELAVSLKTESLYVHPREVDDAESFAERLAAVIDVPGRELQAQLQSDKPFAYLRRFLDADMAAEVRALDLPYPTFGFEPEPKRSYPRGKLAVHVVGYATIDGDGVEGIELTFDETLKGDPTVYLVLQDARHGGVRQLVRSPAKQPHDVLLTLDLVLQHLVERELELAMRETGALAATGVLLDPATGQVLALANRPAADPNHYGQAHESERINRALVHFYEPGSTFKFVPMAAALEVGGLRSTERVFCENGVYTAGGRTIRDISPYGRLTPRQILEKSSNIGMVKITARLEPGELHEAISNFGFGARTGIELPGESLGLVRPVEKWSSFSQDSLAFGQEVAVTAIQMTSGLSVLANDGVRIAPRVVLGTRDPEGRVQLLRAPTPERVVTDGTAAELRGMLESVIETGTGTRASVWGYRMAGKSGTAQKAIDGEYSDTHYVASFGGFGPLSEPRLVGLVVLDSPRGKQHQGGRVAAPVFGRIMNEALRYLRVPTDEDPRRGPVLRPGVETEVAHAARPGGGPTRGPSEGLLADVRGLSLRRATLALTGQGLRVEVDGNGVVVSQQPAPGTVVSPGQTCRLRLEVKRTESPRNSG